jgi:hypothetical protein
MSFTSFMALQVDKESKSFGQSGNDPRNDFLDQFLTFDTADLESSTFLNAPGVALSVRPGSGSESTCAPLTMLEDEARHNPAHHPQGEPAYIDAALLHHKSKGNHFHLSKTRIAADSDFELLSLENISLQSPQLDFSPPSSPNPVLVETVRGRRRLIERLTKPFRKDPDISEQRESSRIRKATSPAKMMSTSQYSGQNIPDWERFALDASKFEFGFQNGSRPISPPPCSRVLGGSEINHNMIPSTQDQGNFTWDHPLPQSYSCRAQDNMVSPLATPPADVTTFQQANALHASTNNMVYASPQRNHASASWTQPPVSSDFSFDTSTAYATGGESTPLWYGNATTAHLAQPSPSNFSQSPSRHNMTSHAMQLQAELAYNANELALSQSDMPSGLMIQNLPGTPGQQSFTIDSSQLGQEQGYFAQVSSTASRASQPQPHHHHRYTPSQPQPPLSEFTSPKIRCDKSHTRTDSSSSPSPKSRSSSFHVSKRRSRSFSRKRSTVDSAGAPKTPKTPNVDFVNFTPDDSMKILTGVAPSGSSKTKARREKEAMEKNRRLSQAAVRAVQAAGGSIESLVEEGLIIPHMNR